MCQEKTEASWLQLWHKCTEVVHDVQATLVNKKIFTLFLFGFQLFQSTGKCLKCD